MDAPSPSKLKSDTIIKNFLNPALTSHYKCRFKPPATMNGFMSSREAAGWRGANAYGTRDEDLIEISCSEASLPGSSLMTNEINDDYTGVTERHAYRRQYDDRIDFTFYVDSNYKIINFFESWIAYCVSENNFNRLGNRDYFYRMNFPDEYQTDDMFITKFDRNHEQSIQYQFIGAYPISITSMPVSYESSQLLKCSVSFTYIRYLLKNRKIIAEVEPKPATVPGVPNTFVTPRTLSEQTRQSQLLNRGVNLDAGPNPVPFNVT
jgi:hypothetical protein